MEYQLVPLEMELRNLWMETMNLVSSHTDKNPFYAFDITIFCWKCWVKIGLAKNVWDSTSFFRVAATKCKNICPERLNWPGRLAGISESHRGMSKYFFLDHFSSSFLSHKWCQISVRIFVYCLAPETYSVMYAHSGFFFRLLLSRWHEVCSFWGIWGSWV